MLRALLLVLFTLLPLGATAQQAATLIADRIEATADRKLIASGSVEVFFDGTLLSAERIIYDQTEDRLSIEGPILITSDDGQILTARQATLDAKLETGILLGARLVLNERLQIAANQVTRLGSSTTQAYKVAATSCAVCGTRAPLWQIRAREVTHDQEAKLLYFKDTEFLLRGVPIVALPRLRMPDPTQTRATGFLIPEIRSNDQLGIGIRTPYFIKWGDRRDVTIAPFLTETSSTLELRYRQAFDRGTIQIDAAASRDTLVPDRLRSYIDAQGRFDVGQDYVLDLSLRAVSDSGYLLQYGYSDSNRLDSSIKLSRYLPDRLSEVELAYYSTLTSTLQNSNPPPTVFEWQSERKLDTIAGGTAMIGAKLEGVVRSGTTTASSRDIFHFGARASWDRQWIAPLGFVVESEAGVILDQYAFRDDTVFTRPVARATPRGQITLRWPLAKNGARFQHIIEPVVSLGWSRTYGGAIPNEDSVRTELDEGNLLSLGRFAGDDGTENGPRGAIGLAWQSFDENCFATRLLAGRAFRGKSTDFSASSGLESLQSDWLIAGRLGLANGFSAAGRALIKDDLSTAKASAEIAWANDRVALTAAYVYLDPDAVEGRTQAVSEWTFDGSVRVNAQWTLAANGRYDIVTRKAARAGVGFGWENECIKVNLTADKRFTSSSTVEPTTDFGLSIELLGFGAGPVGVAAVQSCKQ